MTRLDSEPRPLWTGFLDSARNFPDRPALQVDGREVTYNGLAEKALRLAATLQGANLGEESFTAVFAYRSETAFAGVLGALLAGHGYVPLNRTFPVERTGAMLQRSGCRSLIVDRASAAQLEAVLAGNDARLTVICPEHADVSKLAATLSRHRVVGESELASADKWRAAQVPENAIAYLLFTSGSTGQPKGVMVTNGNVQHYVDYVSRRYALTGEDRVSQTFDMTFDLSAHDMFVAWQNGACVCCPSQKQLIKPGAFINEANLSVWFSVPSMAVFMRRLGVLKPDMYPKLRLSLFCGEALPVEVVREWRRAAPNSIIENIYGPTELTIACTAYRWHDATSPDECEQSVVPIGEPFDGMEALVVDPDLKPVAHGSAGELLMTGPQLSRGYWQDEEKTKKAFVTVPDGTERTYYRTGDRVRRRGPGKPLTYLGRLDSQIKVLGHRVELGEVESAVRDLSGYDGVVALGWPATAKGADAIEVFLQADECDTQRLLEQLRLRLPPYMVPRHIRLLSRFPLNSNGKFDRAALLKRLEGAEIDGATLRSFRGDGRSSKL